MLLCVVNTTIQLALLPVKPPPPPSTDILEANVVETVVRLS